MQHYKMIMRFDEKLIIKCKNVDRVADDISITLISLCNSVFENVVKFF